MKYGFLLLITIFVLGGCSQEQPKQVTNEKHKQVPHTVNTALPKIDHIVIVVEENHSQKRIYGNTSAAYINFLMKNGANLMNYYAIEHPSQPNYLDLFSGSNQGVTNDSVPKHKFSAKNLASELIEKNYTFAGYSEDLPSTGFNGGSTGPGGYARKHNPWVNFTNVPDETNKRLEDFPKDFKQLPTVSFVIPTLKHDMHDGTIKEGDLWLKQHIDPYVQWAKEHNSLLVVTWDEDDFSQGNKIPAFFVGPMVKKEEFNEKANHFNLLRTIEDIYGLSHAGASGQVNPIISIWK
jgi:hypothetical protein